MIKNTLTTLLIISVLFLVSCSENLLSIWKNSEISIDGNKEDWEGKLTFFEDEKAALGIVNNNDHLYLCLVTNDQTKINQLLHGNLTIWLDPQSSDGQTFGIQYPIQKMPDFNMKQEKPNSKPDFNSNKNENDERNIAQRIEMLKASQNEILVVNEDEFPLFAYKMNNEVGLEASINYEINQLIYEMKIPIGNLSDQNFFVDILPGEEVALSFESGKMKKPENEFGSKNGGMNQPPSGNNGVGGPGGGGRGRQMGGGGPPHQMQSSESFDFTLNVTLAKK